MSVQRIAEFDIWRPGYGGATVTIYVAGTTTLAAVFFDAAMTLAAPNPIVLQTQTIDGISYGKFPQTLHIGGPYQLLIDGQQLTGVQRIPIADLDDEDASRAVVQSARGSVLRALEDWTDDVIIAAAWGQFGVNATQNTTILNAAIGAAAAQGGGVVMLPPGTIEFNTLSLPQDVRLRGQGRLTTILRSIQSQTVVTLAGDGAGLEDLTLDGAVLAGSSLGFYAVGRTALVMRNVIVKRFDRGFELRGGTRVLFQNFDVVNCTECGDVRGDLDAGNASQGGTIEQLRWEGGRVGEGVDWGIRIYVEDRKAHRISFRQVEFSNNVGPSVRLRGAQMVQFDLCRFDGNTAFLDVDDGEDADETPTQRVAFNMCVVRGGTATFAGSCDKIEFRKCEIDDVDFQLNTPQNYILLTDCVESILTSAAGNTEKLVRNNGFKVQEVFGITTDATPTAAWFYEPPSGEYISLAVRVIGKATTGFNTAAYWLSAIAYRQSDTIPWDLPSATIPQGEFMVGLTSGARARMPYTATPAAASGVFSIRDITGTFISGETVQFESGVTARLTATATPGATAIAGSVQNVVPQFEADAAWNCTIDASANLIRVMVTGVAGLTIEWFCEINFFQA